MLRYRRHVAQPGTPCCTNTPSTPPATVARGIPQGWKRTLLHSFSAHHDVHSTCAPGQPGQRCEQMPNGGQVPATALARLFFWGSSAAESTLGLGASQALSCASTAGPLLIQPQQRLYPCAAITTQNDGACSTSLLIHQDRLRSSHACTCGHVCCAAFAGGSSCSAQHI
jgi:hypothetical protein